MSIIEILIILSLAVIIHEFGHFLMAKKLKIKVYEFGFGYPPRIKYLFEKWGTKFSLNAIPIGGFVSFEQNEQNNKQKHKNTVIDLEKEKKLKTIENEKEIPLSKARKLKFLAIVLAGPIANLVSALFAFFILFFIIGIPRSLDNRARVGAIIENSPAQKANFPVNSEIKMVMTKDGKEFIKVNSIQDVIDFVNNHKGQELVFVVNENCYQLSCDVEEKQYTVYARRDDEKGENEGSVGIVFEDVYFEKNFPPIIKVYLSLKQAFITEGKTIFYVFKSLKNVFTSTNNMTGPIGLASQAHKMDIKKWGIEGFLNLFATISLNLGIFNLLPLPLLDGGHVFLVFLKKGLRRSLTKFEEAYNLLGYLVLGSLFIYITFHDVFSLLNGN